jgi:hypothetical protein
MKSTRAAAAAAAAAAENAASLKDAFNACAGHCWVSKQQALTCYVHMLLLLLQMLPA